MVEDTRIGHIYIIVCSKSNDIYVGSTFNAPRTRMSLHKRIFNNGSGFAIYPTLKQHGWECLKMMLIASYEVVDRKHLLMCETLWIHKLRSVIKCLSKRRSEEKQPNSTRKKKKTVRAIHDRKVGEIAHKRVIERQKVERKAVPDMTDDEVFGFKMRYYKERIRIYHDMSRRVSYRTELINSRN
ncbi:hypothetical protein PybrP1_003823 [[Pythium] brassicae (nom. inval.)]|nr:hypothetical protein PybrP1_003823 [[Pythium] brassicae (nom. inval.)]